MPQPQTPHVAFVPFECRPIAPREGCEALPSSSVALSGQYGNRRRLSLEFLESSYSPLTFDQAVARPAVCARSVGGRSSRRMSIRLPRVKSTLPRIFLAPSIPAYHHDFPKAAS